MEDLEKAKDILAAEGCTCVVCKGSVCHRSHHRGVRPLLDWLDSGTDMMGFSACDKVVGKGAALLYCLLGVRRVHGQVMSLAAKRVFRDNGIEASWDRLVEGIRNRTNTGPCPIEAACAAIDDPYDAPQAIRIKLAQLKT